MLMEAMEWGFRMINGSGGAVDLGSLMGSFGLIKMSYVCLFNFLL